MRLTMKTMRIVASGNSVSSQTLLLGGTSLRLVQFVAIPLPLSAVVEFCCVMLKFCCKKNHLDMFERFCVLFPPPLVNSDDRLRPPPDITVLSFM